MQHIFREYDIRGRYGDDLTNKIAYAIGAAIAHEAITPTNNKICVGFDGRHSSPTLLHHLSRGLIDHNAEIISVGLVATPTLYYADKKFSPAASIMVGGSHNPKEDNGFKIIIHGKPVYGFAIQELKNIASTIIHQDSELNQDKIKQYNINQEYLTQILAKSISNTKLKIVWDPGNGAASDILKLLIDKLPNQNIIINGEIDGSFPAHPPDPTVAQNLEQLITKVKSTQSDLGFAFDGDGDRLGVVDQYGEICDGDTLMCLFSQDILKKHPQTTIITDVKVSNNLIETIKRNNGKALMWKTGHSLIKDKMVETGALLGGEISGHFFFADRYYGFDDAIYAALRLVAILEQKEQSLANLMKAFPKKFTTPEIRFNVGESQKFQIIRQIKQILNSAEEKYIDIDGMRVIKNNGDWWLIRASNTEAAIVLRIESENIEGLRNLKQEINQLLKPYQLKIN